MNQQPDIKKFLKNWNEIVVKYQQPSMKKGDISNGNFFPPLSRNMGIDVPHARLVLFIYARARYRQCVFLRFRVFIIQHDCGHQSFFKSRKLNNVIGFVCSFISSMPYRYWAKSHDFHHAHCGQLEEGVRDIGDITVLTVEEYQALTPVKKFGYRVYRNPAVMFFFGPIYYLLVNQRLPLVTLKGWKKTYRSQAINNIFDFRFVRGIGLFFRLAKLFVSACSDFLWHLQQ